MQPQAECFSLSWTFKKRRLFPGREAANEKMRRWENVRHSEDKKEVHLAAAKLD